MIFDRKTRRLVYQNASPQFFLVRSISFGEILISFLMFITGRALGRRNAERNTMKK